MTMIEPVAILRSRSANRPEATARRLDRVDLQILAVLQKLGRISKSALAQKVNLSPSACYERMSRLERWKLIQSYHAMVNLRAIMPLQSFITQISLRSHTAADFRRFEAHVVKVPEIVECHALGGGIDYMLKIVASDVEEYEGLIQTMLDAQIGIERYFTYIVTKPVKQLQQYELSNLL